MRRPGLQLAVSLYKCLSPLRASVLPPARPVGETLGCDDPSRRSLSDSQGRAQVAAPLPLPHPSLVVLVLPQIQGSANLGPVAWRAWGPERIPPLPPPPPHQRARVMQLACNCHLTPQGRSFRTDKKSPAAPPTASELKGLGDPDPAKMGEAEASES